MMKRVLLFSFSLVCLTAAACTTARAADDEYPGHLLGLFERGMHVHVTSIQGNPAFQLEIYDIQQEQYEAVQERRREALQRVQRGDAPLGLQSRFLLGTVRHVGDNYLIIAYGEDKSSMQVIPARYISSIRWQDEVGSAISERSGDQDATAKTAATNEAMKSLSKRIKEHWEREGSLPKSLESLRGDVDGQPRETKSDQSQQLKTPEDSWGHEIVYTSRERRFQLSSAGPDEKLNTDDDLLVVETVE